MIFSIVIPVYNTNPIYLKECVNSILCQSFTNYEIIMVDDGSTDGSGELCDLLAAKSNKIKVIHKPNGGVSSARNEGISVANGKWLLFCDADDTLQHDCLKSIYQSIMRTSYDLYKYHYNLLTENGSCQSIPLSLCEPSYSSDEYLRLLLRHKIIGSCWGYVFRTDYVKQIKFNTALNIGEDTLFVINYLLLFSGDVFVSPTILYNYRSNPQSVTKDWRKICSEIDSVNNNIKLLMNHYSVLEKFKVEYNTYVVHNLFFTHIWRHKIPSQENQQFLMANGDNCYEEDIDIVMKRYIHFLKMNRIIGNIYLKIYYCRIILFSSVVKFTKFFYYKSRK